MNMPAMLLNFWGYQRALSKRKPSLVYAIVNEQGDYLTWSVNRRQAEREMDRYDYGSKPLHVVRLTPDMAGY